MVNHLPGFAHFGNLVLQLVSAHFGNLVLQLVSAHFGSLVLQLVSAHFGNLVLQLMSATVPATGVVRPAYKGTAWLTDTLVLIVADCSLAHYCEPIVTIHKPVQSNADFVGNSLQQ